MVLQQAEPAASYGLCLNHESLVVLHWVCDRSVQILDGQLLPPKLAVVQHPPAALVISFGNNHKWLSVPVNQVVHRKKSRAVFLATLIYVYTQSSKEKLEKKITRRRWKKDKQRKKIK